MSPNFIERLHELPGNLSNHLMITVIALCVGISISLPMAVILARRKHLRYPILTGASVMQTIPSLALLALMVPILDRTAGLGLGLSAFGFPPAVIALTLYSVLPVLRNTVTGILNVDPAMTEAARGMGMTPLQVLWKVELPLSAPVIIAGIRTATTWVVGIATLATPVGQRCLGNYIFTGLQTRNWIMVLFGVVLAAMLAILLDLFIGGLQKAVDTRKRTLGILSITGLVVIVVGGLFSPLLVQKKQPTAPITPLALAPGQSSPACRQVIRIGGKTFSEQYILTSLLAVVLQKSGFHTRQIRSLGSTIVFDALCAGELDVYVDYSGTIWTNYMKQKKALPAWQVLARIGAWTAEQHAIRTLGTLGFENAYAIAMPRKRARKLGIKSLSDLIPYASDMKIGGDYEFFGRPEWSMLRHGYTLGFAEQISYDSSLMYAAVVEGQVDVIAAFSSDGRIEAFDLVLLEDPLDIIPPYDAVLLLGPQVASCEPLVRALYPLLDAISVEQMRHANLLVDRNQNKQTVNQAAAWLHAKISHPKPGR